jgi:acyl carrier protein
LPGDAAARPIILAHVGARRAARRGRDTNGAALDEATGLLGQGIGLDSVEVLQLVSAIEEAWSLTIDDEDLQREHFATLGTVVTFIQERLSA